MEPIELTDSEKDKLLEMAEELFPEYDFEFKLENNILSLGEKHLDLYTDTIHWFEFCMTQLPNRLYPLYDSAINGTGADFQTDMFQVCIDFGWKHPIDYLYEQFKELK